MSRIPNILLKEPEMTGFQICTGHPRSHWGEDKHFIRTLASNLRDLEETHYTTYSKRHTITCRGSVHKCTHDLSLSVEGSAFR